MEVLEERSLMSVTFQFLPDELFRAQFPAEALQTLELAGRVVGRSLGVDLVIPVTVTAQPLLPEAIARGGPTPWGGQMIFDRNFPWHFGRTTIGLVPGSYDFFTVVEHELGHVLGVGTRASWTDGVKVAISPDTVHLGSSVDAVMSDSVVISGRRKLFTNIDFDVLDGLGWKTVRPAPPEFAFVSRLDADGHCRLYVFSREGVRFLADTGSFHVTFTDLDYDGVADAVITPMVYGYTVGYNRANGELYFAVTLGQSLVVSYL